MIDRIVAEIEMIEKRRDEDRAAGIAESHDDVDIHEKIKRIFYREVFKDPSIRVLHPMIGVKSHPFTNKFSCGQRMALNLLWMLKIADYAVEREVRREAASFSQLKRLREQQERMFIIDGMFSNLSDSRIIKETLSAIGRLKTKVQLIGFYHNPVHVFDENIFQTYIYGDQVLEPGNSAGYVFLREGKMVFPKDVGRVEGQIAVIDNHFDKIEGEAI